MKELFECQFCGSLYFEDIKDFKEHLECYHKKEFDMIPKNFWN